MTKPQSSTFLETSLSRIPCRYVLRGCLYDLRELDGTGLATRVAFEFELRDLKTFSYSHDEPVNGKDVTAVVAAMDRNVQSGLSEVAGGLEQYFNPCSGRFHGGALDPGSLRDHSGGMAIRQGETFHAKGPVPLHPDVHPLLSCLHALAVPLLGARRLCERNEPRCQFSRSANSVRAFERHTTIRSGEDQRTLNLT
jgi:hypothetical protein